ncbi:MAG TPA: hypothetical protein PKD16_18370, partial [Saprospiraceae bacterium]|nr:hypothetical protein [Saprospiraceae bacterium]HMT72141.1 hypothetical protein [Saprospiraceae bacterium]
GDANLMLFFVFVQFVIHTMRPHNTTKSDKLLSLDLQSRYEVRQVEIESEKEKVSIYCKRI